MNSSSTPPPFPPKPDSQEQGQPPLHQPAVQKKAEEGSESLALNSSLGRVMEWTYEHVLAGQPTAGLVSAHELAMEYSARSGSLDDKIDALIKWQSAKAATSGFLTGLGGIATMPILLPTNMLVVLFVQMRMLAAIAILCGRDVHDSRVKSEIFLALLGNATGHGYREVGMQVGHKIAVSLADRVTYEVIRSANQAATLRILTYLAPRGLVRMSRVIPLAGGIIGAAFDAVSTRVAGRAAKKLFLPGEVPA
ncbi:MAG TPA: EcsC family protein [Candidatus Methylacidiphilales bacterium]|nr:EcsC family protein [Candidatus Methylacidiphilales bacterium]